MATATASNTTSATVAATGGQGADDNYTATGQSADGAADPQGDTTPGDSPSQPATAAASAADPGSDNNRSSDPLRAERRKTNQLEKEIRTLRQQLNRTWMQRLVEALGGQPTLLTLGCKLLLLAGILMFATGNASSGPGASTSSAEQDMAFANVVESSALSTADAEL